MFCTHTHLSSPQFSEIKNNFDEGGILRAKPSGKEFKQSTGRKFSMVKRKIEEVLVKESEPLKPEVLRETSQEDRKYFTRADHFANLVCIGHQLCRNGIGGHYLQCNAPIAWDSGYGSG